MDGASLDDAGDLPLPMIADGHNAPAAATAHTTGVRRRWTVRCTTALPTAIVAAIVIHGPEGR